MIPVELVRGRGMEDVGDVGDVVVAEGVVVAVAIVDVGSVVVDDSPVEDCLFSSQGFGGDGREDVNILFHSL